MRATIYNGPRDIELGERPDPQIVEPTDAVVRVTLACVCGSDLWYYRGINPHSLGSIGHEFIGVVEQIGSDVRGLAIGDFVVAPFRYSDGTCPDCLAGMTSACAQGSPFGTGTVDGGQGEAVRVPFADATLVNVPGSGFSDSMLASILSLTDVMATGHHAAISAEVQAGDVVAVVGDGAVGLCGVIAAKRLGASRIIALSRNSARQALAREFGATDIVSERGDEATEAVRSLTDGVGVDATLECVGSPEALRTSLGVARAGSIVGFVGVPNTKEVPLARLFRKNIGLHGGSAPVRAYLPELLADVLAERINPGLVFDYSTDLAGIKDAYAAMDERRAVKSLLRVSEL